jgi:phosphoribosylaminoimidazole-succinocarboxamide synthase
MSRNIVPNWILSVPDPNVAIGIKCDPIMIEMVIRGYLSGHSWRMYKSGERVICGVAMPEGMKENDAFPEPIITPATKASDGHDEDISAEEIIAQNILPESEYRKIEKLTKELFKLGTEYASEKGLILVDTKYEFGYHNDEIILMDEIHTPDSSRYFYKDSYADLQAKGEKQKQLSKEFIREWLMENNFQGLEGQEMPAMDDDIVERVSNRYLELYNLITDQELAVDIEGDVYQRMEKNILLALQSLK